MSKYPAAVPLRVCVAGVTGWTGSAVAAAVEAADADELVDYTNAVAVKRNVLAALDRHVAVVVGSSGLSAADYEEIDERARQLQVGVIAAGNFSLTAALVLRFATEA